LLDNSLNTLLLTPKEIERFLFFSGLKSPSKLYVPTPGKNLLLLIPKVLLPYPRDVDRFV